jgi:hypothetical protein
MNRFDNDETRKIDRQTILAPQYGITRLNPQNLRKKVLRQKRNLRRAEKARSASVAIVE